MRSTSTRDATGTREDARAGLLEWFARPPGSLVREAETRLLRRVLPDYFGYFLLQVGRLSPVEVLGETRVLWPLVLETDAAPGAGERPRVRGAASLLPVASDSVDVIILPHVLETEADPHETLREAQRALVPEGHLLLLGFNPWSMLGLYRVVAARRASSPWRGAFLGMNRVKDWLALLGFDVTSTEGFFYRPPLRNRRLMARLEPLEDVGARAWPYLAGAYMIVAKKRVTMRTRAKTRWLPRRRLVSVGLAEPSARVAEDTRARG